MRVRLDQTFIARAKAAAGAERTIYWDQKSSGFGLVVTGAGHKSFVAQYRIAGMSRRLNLDGKFLHHEARRDRKVAQVALPKSGAVTLADAKREFAAVQGAIARGRDPLAEMRAARTAEKHSLQAITEAYLASQEGTLRTINERRAVFRRYIWPRMGARPIGEIRRSEIVRMLDKVKDDHGEATARHTLAAIRRLFNWHAARDDSFRSPIVRGMLPSKTQKRERVLADDELRAVWRAAAQDGQVKVGNGSAPDAGTAYQHLIRFILLTATRLNEAARMNRSELSEDGRDWTIPGGRHKSKRAFLLPLSDAACDALSKVPAVGKKGWVFTTTGEGPISGFSKSKIAFDKLVLAEFQKIKPGSAFPHWTPHDLRRTARTLMSRAGVVPDHAERALGHVVGGVRGVYDLYEFKEEKLAAFEALAAQIARIVDPKPNVVPLKGRGRK